MTIRILKAQTINGTHYAADVVVIGLDKDVEARAIEGGGAVLETSPVSGAGRALIEGEVASAGTLVCSWQLGVTGSTSSTVPYLDAGVTAGAAPHLSGAGSTFVASSDVANLPSTFRALKLKVRAPKRVDGSKFVFLQLSLGKDNTFTDRMLVNFTVKADGKVKRYVFQKAQFGTGGAFVVGTDTINAFRVSEQAGSGAAGVTLTGAPAVGASSATMTANFGAGTGEYYVRFSTGEVRLAKLVAGSAAVAWDLPLTVAGATTAMSYYPVRTAMQAGDSVQFGALYRDPVSKAFLGVSFDDGTKHQVEATTQLTTDFVGISGITVPAGFYSMCDLAERFGLRSTLFVLTRHVGQPGGFATVAQLLAMQARGHLIALQTHANPLDGNNAGMRLLGPYGYYVQDFVYGSVAGDSANNKLTTGSAHKVIRVNSGGLYGDQGYPVQMFGTNLPAPLDTVTKYWLAELNANDLRVYLTEADSMAGTNPVVLTSNGTNGNWGYRYWGSAPDSSAILADFRAGQALLQQWGFNGWRHLALNQGGWDAHVEEACRILQEEGSLLTVRGTQGNTGAASASFFPRSPAGYFGGAVGSATNTQLGTSLSEVFNLPVALDTDAAVQATSQAYVQAICAAGAIGFSYHHHQANTTKMAQQCAYYDAVAYARDLGLCLTGTAEDLYLLLKSANVA
jgi:hypothetical protein